MITSTTLRRASAAAVALTALALAGCSSDADTEASTTPADGTSPAPTAESAALDTVTDGTLTIATGEPAYEPWVLNDDPASGEGFEAAVAYAVAAELGFAPEDVEWVRTTFDAAIAPGAKDWDVNLQQFSITDERRNAVDFSSAYYTTTQAIVTIEGNEAASATSAAELEGSAVGVAVGTTSYTVAAEAFGEDNLQVFNSVGDVVGALNAGQIDAFVTDLPGAFYSAAVEVEDGVILGQFAGSEGGDEFGFVLPKDSPNTEAVTAAVDALREDGTLAALELQWLSDAVDVPVIE
ncbi:ABC transporter substrate-binding protein [Demequina aestuarii]|uniref:ABC transporter substrate-binding protein n=1 Tax=Demequina aestuarii TaxID=327095 RepID=UPI000782DA1F|nr:ABC transporter substrate-binding protein [Demequina aestuarii]